jgi:ribosomal protein L11 methylase PrmA
MGNKKLFLTGKIADEKISFLINKIVEFAFSGEKLKFYLSHALFSSFNIDVGTRLLLKTIAQKINFDSVVNAKDIGAGAGIIGISLKKRYPHLAITFTDRDMLALSFTKINCEFNGIKDYHLSGELDIETFDARYDFIVSNIPAKIGDKGLENLIKKILFSLDSDGICAVVVIKPLEEKIREMLSKNHALIGFEEEGNAHWVFHFKPCEDRERIIIPANVLEPYLRGNITQRAFGFSYKLKTVYNLPDFDTLGYQSELLLKLLENERLSGVCLFWNPLQGHIPVIVYKMFSIKISKYILAGRDMLQLKIARDNLESNGVPRENISISHVSLISEVTESVNNYLIIPDIIPMVNSYDLTLKGLQTTNIFISDKSTNIFRLLENQQTYQTRKKIKKNGFTAVCLMCHNRCIEKPNNTDG